MEIERLENTIIEIAGYKRVLVEHHSGVTSYGADHICVRVKYGQISIRGSGMVLAQMCRTHLVVCGCIESVTLLRGDA
jgi:sporulation protein YqfC